MGRYVRKRPRGLPPLSPRAAAWLDVLDRIADERRRIVMTVADLHAHHFAPAFEGNADAMEAIHQDLIARRLLARVGRHRPRILEVKARG